MEKLSAVAVRRHCLLPGGRAIDSAADPRPGLSWSRMGSFPLFGVCARRASLLHLITNIGRTGLHVYLPSSRKVLSRAERTTSGVGRPKSSAGWDGHRIKGPAPEPARPEDAKTEPHVGSFQGTHFVRLVRCM
jgi:hypothetical protein